MDFTINFGAINLLVVFAATVASNLLGGLWYSPFMLGKPWRSVSKLVSTGEMPSPIGTFISSFVMQLIAASLLAALLGPSVGGKEGLQLGLIIGIGFVFTAIGVTNLFEKRPFTLILINAGYHVVALGLMGFIIGTWG